MAKRKHIKKTQPSPTTQSSSNKVTSQEHLDEVILGLEIMEEEKIPAEEKEALEKAQPSAELIKEIETNNLKESWHRLKMLWEKADRVKDQYGKLKSDLEQEKIELEAKRKAYSDLQEKLKVVSGKEEEIRKKEEEAKAGFPELKKNLQKEHEEKIKQLEEAKEIVKKKEDAIHEKIKGHQEQLEQKYSQKHDELHAEISHRREDLRTKERALKSRELDIHTDEAILLEKKEDFKNSIEKYNSVELERARMEIEERDKSRLSLFEMIKELQEEKAKLEGHFAKFGQKSPEEIEKELSDLRSKNAKLRDELADSLSKSEKQKLKALEKQTTDLEEKNRALFEEKEALRSKYQISKIGVTQIFDLQAHVSTLEDRINLKESIIEDLEQDIKGYTQKMEGKESFEFCIGMDKNEYLQKDPQFSKPFTALGDLCKYLKHKVAEVEGTHLFYSDRVIKTFLGGMAMSQLSLLQGISGTGKTSLPRAIAKAMGGTQEEPVEIIEVQSGWRDRQDLLGFYNTFEKKYYESNFLKALYKASTPRYKDMPFFIILDEMNLSHPEHYFADLLSQIENVPTKRKLEIIASTNQIPGLIKHEDNGLFLPIPPNVWFIGTANHDETTLEFAPKTYDRANVMEMPKNPDKFEIDSQRDLTISYENLNALFEKAGEKHPEKVGEAQKFLDEQLRPMVQKFGLGWGNRLEKQLSKFLPVVVEASETSKKGMEEGLDHIVASKIFRNLRNRFDIQKKQYVQLKKEFELAFADFGEATESMAILDKEIQRSGGDEG